MPPASTLRKHPARLILLRLYAWSIRMDGYGGPAQPSPTIGQGLPHGCYPQAARYVDLDAGSRPEMPERAAMRRRAQIKLTATQKITPYQLMHPDEER
jgi:hypothetical protein